MASRVARVMAGRLDATRSLSTATYPRMKPVTATADEFVDSSSKKGGLKADMVPVYVLFGMVAVTVGIAAHTAKQQLVHSPSVRVNKKKRESVPEVYDPDRVTNESDKFLNKSLFRKVAHIQDFDSIRAGMSDPTRVNPFNSPRKTETLKSVGVDPSRI